MYPSGLIWDQTFPGSVDGAVVVADTGYNRISVYDPISCPNPDNSTCAPLESFGSFGTANLQFNTPRDVAVDAQHDIYVADAANNRIQAFTSTGLWLWTAGKAASNCSGPCLLSTPIGISFDPTTNEVLVADTGHSEIKAFAGVGGVPASGGFGPFTAGQFMWQSPKGVMRSPREARRGPDGEIWVADYNDERVVAFQCACTTSSASWNSTPNKMLGDGLTGGHKNGEVNSPYNVSFSPDGQFVYVADTGNERIAVFSSTNCTGANNQCAWIANYGSRCPNPCPAPPGNAAYFNALRRVSVDPATGNIWAADFWGSGIHEFSPTGAPMLEIDGSAAPASGFAEAYGVAVGPDGTTYVADRLNQRIEEFDAGGNYVGDEGSRGVAPGQYSWPEAVAVAPDRTVWVGDTRNGRLQHFPANLSGTPTIVGTKGAAAGQYDYIEGVGAAASGVLWAADTVNNRIESYNPSSHTFAVFGTKGSGNAQFNLPESVAVSTTDMYVADTLNNRIEELDFGGHYVASYTGLDAPQGITLAPDGTLWVANTGVAQTDTDGNSIVHLSSALTLLGGGFGGPGTGNMQFFEPHSLAVSPDGTTLFVADTYNNRVQEFSIATQLAFTTSPGGAKAGALLDPQPVVTVEDVKGHPVTGDTGTVTIAITPGTGTPGAKLTCGSGLTVAEVNGVASFTGCSVDTAGSGYSLTATDGSIPSSTSASFGISGGTVGPPARLVFTPSPGGAAPGALLSPQPVVSIEDANGNTVTTDTSIVTIAVTPGTGSSGALTCADTDGTSVQAVQGVAAFGSCSISTAGNGYTLTASDPDDSLPNAASGSFNVATVIGPATRVAFTTMPGGATPGSPLNPQPVVAVEDANGNTVTTDQSAVTLAITPGTGGGALTCSGGLTATASAGVATFSGCSISKSGSGFTLTATDGSLTSAVSASFNIVAGAPAQLSFTTSPGGAGVGAAFTPQPVVAVEDAGGNAVGTDSSVVTIAITPATGAAGATLTCTETGGLSVQAVNGVASFGGCSIDEAGAGYTLTATDTGDSLPAATSASFNVSEFAPAYSGQIYSPNGAASIYPDGGAVDANGNVYITDSGNSQVLEDPKISTSSPSFGIAVAAGPASQLALTSMPVNAAPGTAFASQPVVAVEDADGDTVSTDTSLVTLAITAGTGASGAVLSCTDTSGLTVQAINGVASFSGCAVDLAAHGYTLTATDNGLAPVVSPAFNITPSPIGAPTQIAFVSAPGGGAPGAAFGSQPAVAVEDASGNIVTTDSSTVTISITPGTGTGGAGLTCTDSGGLTVAIAGGVATFSGCSIDSAGTGYTLTAFDSNYGNLRVLVPASFGLNHPRGLELDPGGTDLWVPDTENNRLIEFTLNGAYVRTLGSANTKGGHLKSPYGIVFDATQAYVADTYGYNVVAYNRATSAVAWTTSSASPVSSGTGCDGKALTRTRGIGMGSDGNVYVTDTDNNRIVVLNASGACVRGFGKGGGGQGQMRAPRDVIGDGGNGVWVTDAGNYRLDHLTLTGGFISETTSGHGSGPSQFVSPQTVFADGSLIDVSDTYNYDIEEFSVDGSGNPVYADRIAQGTPPANPGFNGAWSVAYGPSGELYAADWFNHRVEKFKPDGTFALAFGSYGDQPPELEYPRGIAVSADGTYVAVAQENNNVEEFTSAGVFKADIAPADHSGLHRPRQVDIAPDGSLWVADYGHNRVLHLSTTGAILLNLTHGGVIKAPQGVVLDTSGHVFVSDSGNNGVEEYTTSGTFIATLTTPGHGPTQTTSPSELALVGPVGSQILLIADSGNNRVLALSIAGTTVTPDLSFGLFGSGPAQFSQPTSVAYDTVTGQIAVADFMNSRVSLWDSGPPIASSGMRRAPQIERSARTLG